MSTVQEDMPDTVNEKATTRMYFRAKPSIKATIQQAAALSGVDASTFAMSAAYHSAMQTLAAHQRTTLEAVDHEAFFSALDNAPAPTEKLREAFLQRDRTSESR
ncbi:MAG: DUF1778 domain-containing protein [Halomonas sp.]|uniref:type II toxin-antitoxin system TacA family antitoxin n=1 Tax=Halomonas sp. TaxID=1486246 RepID=UPI002ACE6D5E|nr:DUF1778 domain-containing protein [Halomonas sp.]MDZ7852771.1 DUF1778 domain-containing protein [Halomonas sp.]